MSSCKAMAKKLVNSVAAGGLAAAAIPVPGTSVGLAAGEALMVKKIASIYGETLSTTEAVTVLAGLGVASMGFKIAAMEACNLIPVAGWIVKSGIAGSAIKTIGTLAINHYENKYPMKEYAG